MAFYRLYRLNDSLGAINPVTTLEVGLTQRIGYRQNADDASPIQTPRKHGGLPHVHGSGGYDGQAV